MNAPGIKRTVIKAFIGRDPCIFNDFCDITADIGKGDLASLENLDRRRLDQLLRFS